jgi:hypothetical protein
MGTRNEGDLFCKHKGLQIAVLCISLAAASIAIYLGTMIYAFSIGPMVGRHYVRNRCIAVSFLFVAFLLNVLMVRMLGLANRGMGFRLRYGLSFGTSLIGAILVYVVIWRGLWPLFSS